jgi:hypothetical protein
MHTTCRTVCESCESYKDLVRFQLKTLSITLCHTDGDMAFNIDFFISYYCVSIFWHDISCNALIIAAAIFFLASLDAFMTADVFETPN